MADRPVLALYRRYRPDTFADVIGQDHVIGPLTAAIAKGRINHAYLFSGPRGCGKTTSARVLARSLNCAQGPTPTPCGVCPSCVDLARGGPGSLDVIEIDAASHRGIDDARDLRDRVTFAPVRDHYKVVIIDEAHQITNDGFSALLKIVEEPPEHVVFIFATTEPEKVLGTIRSRTHHFPFRLVPPRRLMPYLEQLCIEEGVTVAPGALGLVLRAGGGSVRDTLSVLDQLIAGAGPAGVDLDAASDLLGYVPEGLLDDMVDALAAVDGAAAFGVVHRAVEGGHDPRRFAHDLLERLRALVIVSRVGDAAGDVLPDQPPDAVERLRSQAGRFGVAELSRAADSVATALADMAGATSSRLLLELLVARLLVVSSEAGAVLAARLDRLERQAALVGAGVAAGRQAAQATPPAPPAKPPSEALGANATGAAPAVAQSPPAVAQSTTAAGQSAPAVAQSGPAVAPWPVDESPSAARQAPHRESAAGTPPAGASPAGAAPSGRDRPSPEHAAAAPAPSGMVTVDVLRRSWETVTDALREIKRLTWSLVSENAQVISLDERALTLGFATQGLTDTFNNRGHGAVMREALVTSLGVDRLVVAVVSPRGGQQPAVPSASAPGISASAMPTAATGATRPSGTAPEPPPDWDDVEPLRPPTRRSPAVQPPPPPAGAPEPDRYEDPQHDSTDAPPDGAHGAALVERLLGGKVIGEE